MEIQQAEKIVAKDDQAAAQAAEARELLRVEGARRVAEQRGIAEAARKQRDVAALRAVGEATDTACAAFETARKAAGDRYTWALGNAQRSFPLTLFHALEALQRGRGEVQERIARLTGIS